MKSDTSRSGAILSVCFVLFLFAAVFTAPVQAQTYQIRSQDDLPFPYDPYEGVEPIVTIDAVHQIYQVQDNTNDWNMLMAAQELDVVSMTMSADSLDPGDTNDSGGGTYTNSIQPRIVFGSNDLWIEITNADIINQQASLLLHGTVSDEHYQLLTTNVLSGDGESWTLGEFITGAAATNLTPFDSFFTDTNSQNFFRAHHANPVLQIFKGSDAIQPNPTTGDPGQVGYFVLQSYYPTSNDLTVHYSISGTAIDGLDYSNLTGVATVPAGSSPSTNILVGPYDRNRMQGDKTVTLIIQQTNDYLIDPNAYSASLSILDSFTVISVFQDTNSAYRPDGPSSVPAQAGDVAFHRDVSGTASNGVDYTFLTGTLDFPAGVADVSLEIIPLAESTLQGVKTVIITLIPTNSYFINSDTNYDSQTIQIFDSSTTVSISPGSDAIETNSALGVGQDGYFVVSRSDTRGDLPPLTVPCQIGGTASNGVDYVTLPNTITFADGAETTNIYVRTLQDNLIEGDETVTLTLHTNGNSYYLDNSSNATVVIHDSIGFFSVATNLDGPIGIDYYAPSNSLIVSYHYDSSGVPFVFARIYTNIVLSGGVAATNVVVTNWSGINAMSDEIKLATVKTPAGMLTNSAGFTNGDMFFGNDTLIGYLSASGTHSNMNWGTLTNATITNLLPLRGSLCMDQTGTFSNNLIAVTSSGPGSDDPKGVWIVDAHAHPTLLTNFATKHLEGVTTLTNDVQKWGPWAGKIITGDEDTLKIFTIANNGALTSYDTTALITNGIAPEDFDLIPVNQNLFITAYNNKSIMELPAAYFANNVGDLLITAAGEDGDPGLFIVHWNAVGSNFITISIPIPDAVNGHIEHVTFAPITFPSR